MARRGPDGEGSFYSQDRRIGLVHRRLAIIDLSQAGAQPMRDEESGTTIVFNGEIYNYRNLRDDLVARGHVFRSSSDTEVLLKLYAEYGDSMPLKMRGMYAFAIWDEPNASLLLARDPFGMKPLYVADDGATIRFASQVKALLATNQIDPQPDPAGQVGFFLWGHIPEPFTLYRNIHALPAGSALRIDAQGKLLPSTFYIPARQIEGLEPNKDVRSTQDARAILAEALHDTVRHHLIADVPVGVFLSAGLDSSTLLALSCDTTSQKPKALTLSFEEYENSPLDEAPLAAIVARAFGCEHVLRRVAKEDFEDNFLSMIASMDQPTIDGVNTYFVCKAARESGVKVAMSGVGADELFAGYQDFKRIPKLVRTLALASKVPGLGSAFRQISLPALKRFTSPKYASLFELAGDYCSAYLLNRSLFLPWEITQLLEPDVVGEGLERLGTSEAMRATLPNSANSRVRVSTLLSAWYMRNQLLRDSDWASMCHSVELRLPFVDIKLWETVISLVLAGYPLSKRDMALSPLQRLPNAILDRPKTGFSIPVSAWLTRPAPNTTFEKIHSLRGWSRTVAGKFGIGRSQIA